MDIPKTPSRVLSARAIFKDRARPLAVIELGKNSKDRRAKGWDPEDIEREPIGVVERCKRVKSNGNLKSSSS